MSKKWLIAAVILILVGVGMVKVPDMLQKDDDKKDKLSGLGLAQQLYENRNTHINDAAADEKLMNILSLKDEIGSYNLELDTAKAPYGLKIEFVNYVSDESNKKMEKYAAVLLALIDNADQVQWTYNESGDGAVINKYYNVKQATDAAGTDIKKAGATQEGVQGLLDKFEIGD